MSYRSEVSRRAQLMLSVNAGARIAYGVGTLLSPAGMARLEMAPDMSAHPEARLFVRAFGGHMIGVGSLAVLALRHRQLHRPAAAAALAIDVADVVSAIVETARRGQLDRDLSGGIVFSACGAASAALALF